MDVTIAELLCQDYRFETGCNQPKDADAFIVVGNHMGPVHKVLATRDGWAWICEALFEWKDGAWSFLGLTDKHDIAKVDRMRVVEGPEYRPTW
ncbi:MAG: hypothetical protein JF593_03095 [Novosphingobium sp.]|nr:hypothetical protein [Novosphingobium sp.]